MVGLACIGQWRSTRPQIATLAMFGASMTLPGMAGLALTIGICFGIYSSVLVASPLVMWLGVSREQFMQVKKEKQEAVV